MDVMSVSYVFKEYNFQNKHKIFQNDVLKS